MKAFLKYGFLLFILFGLVSCGNDDESSNNEGTSRLLVKLVDAPGDYDAVFIDVQEVIIKYNGGQDDVNLAIIQPGVYDLLELTGGLFLPLFDGEVPAGSISQIRLVLGTENSIVVDGETFPLNTPSAQQSGLKVQVHESLEPGIHYEFLLDFDVDKSIVVLGNGGYNLKPIIRASTVAQSGAIIGNVIPLGVQTLVTANDGTVEITAYTNLTTGNFALSGVPPGTNIVLTFQPDPNSGLATEILDGIQVTIGEVTDIGTIELFPL